MVKELLVTTTGDERFIVAIYANEEPETVILRVRNHGLHCENRRRIPADQIEHILLREQQAAQDDTDEDGGFNLAQE